MYPLTAIDHSLGLENIRLDELVRQYDTPLYVYSQREITRCWQMWQEALAPLASLSSSAPARQPVSYAVKANSNLSILKLFADLGAGFDVVSGYELRRLLTIGVDAQRIVFSGVGKTEAELELACTAGIACLNIESVFEYEALERVVATKADSISQPVSVAVRINPNVAVDTHGYISTGQNETKFGLLPEEALSLVLRIAKNTDIEFGGVVSHIGSQIFASEPYVQTLNQLLDFSAQLADRGIEVPVIGLGGGWGLDYLHPENENHPLHLTEALAEAWSKHPQRQAGRDLAFEPGRSLIARGGILLTKVIGLKSRPKHNFLIVDAAMNDYIRPALYQAKHRVVNLHAFAAPQADLTHYDVVGPVCETGDFLALDCPLRAKQNDILAILDAGAYGFCMSSNYNSRVRPAEILLSEGEARLIRARESFADLIAAEQCALD